jgi:hypothetical protein
MTRSILADNLRKFGVAGLFTAAIAFGFSTVAGPATALAQPDSGTWDIEDYDDCLQSILRLQGHLNPGDWEGCCLHSGGVWIPGDFGLGTCVAPPGEPASGSRQVPGNVHVPSDVATLPTATKAPLRPIRVPSDIATVSPVS